MVSRIPVVEDESALAELIAMSLRDAGYDVTVSMPELLVRIRAVLRRKLPETQDQTVQAGALRLDPATRRVTVRRREVRVGPTEFRLLHFLMTHPERVHSRRQLLDHVWGAHACIEERTVDVHVKRLREALRATDCAERVETVRGFGYRLTEVVPADTASA
jgi:two-component system phosphate regulon response regulator PhoB